MLSKVIKVLLIEDDEEDYMITRDVFDDIGGNKYKLDWVSSFSEGQEAIENNTHDIYLVDYRLGRETGLKLLETANKLEYPIPLILLTGNDDYELDLEAMEKGAADFLIKGEINASVLDRSIRYSLKLNKTINQLKQNKSRLKEAQQIAKLGNFEWDIISDKITWSDEHFRIFDLEPQSVPVDYSLVLKYMGSEDISRMNEAMRDLKSGTTEREIEYSITTVKNKTKKLFGKAKSVLNAKNEVVKIKGITQNITQQVERMNRLELLNTSIENAAYPVSWADLNQKITFVNQAFLKLWGYEKEEEIIGRDVLEFSGDAIKLKEIMEGIQVDGFWAGEDNARKKNGDEFRVFVSGNLITDNKENPIGIMASFIDLTKLKEQELRAAREEKKAQTYLEMAGSLIVVVDKDERVSLINKEGANILGFEEKYITGKNWFDHFIPEKEREEVRLIFDKVMAGELEHLEFYENSILSKDKGVRLIRWYNRRIWNAQGEVQGTISSGVDITEQQKARIALEESEQRFRHVVEQLPAGAVIIRGKELTLNAAAEEITGYTSGEISCINDWFEKLYSKDHNNIRAAYEADLKAGFPDMREVELTRKNGSIRWVNFQGYQFGEGVAWLLNDISASKEAEKVLEENRLRLENYAIDLERAVAAKTRELGLSETKLKQASGLAKIGYWEINFENGVSRAVFSKEYCALYEVDENAPGEDSQFFHQFIHPDDLGRVKALSEKAIKDGSGNFYYQAKTTSGKEIYLHAEIRAIQDNNGQLETVFSMVQDITEQKESELQLARSLAKERELGQLKSRFVSMASHEFRTPLTSIMSSVSLIEMLNEKGKMDAQKKYIRRIESSVDNLTSILNDFLSLEKLESGKVDVNTSNIDLEEFIGELKDDVSPMLKENQLLKHNHIGKQEVQMDPHLMKNILLNLLSNAIKYSPANSTVIINTQKDNEKLKIDVVDQGIGIPEEEQKHMFTRFFRANNASNIKGTGLGLTIVKRYLDLMGGDISFTSVENKGTTFVVNIPQ